MSLLVVQPRFAEAAFVESIEAGIPLCVVVTESIPVRGTAEFFQRAVDSGP